jgi:hypothetical protein
MLLETVKHLHPNIDWEKKCFDYGGYDSCKGCPLFHLLTHSNCIHPDLRETPFKDIVEEVLKVIGGKHES